MAGVTSVTYSGGASGPRGPGRISSGGARFARGADEMRPPLRVGGALNSWNGLELWVRAFSICFQLVICYGISYYAPSAPSPHGGDAQSGH